MFMLTDDPLEPIKRDLMIANPIAGACSIFEGWVRNVNDGKEVGSLEYEAYPAFAHAEAARILNEAREKFEVLEVYCLHRTGHLQIGEMAVWCAATAIHRRAAIEACTYLIEEVKARLPIWKKEHYVHEPAKWVACHRCGRGAPHPAEVG